MFDIFMNKNVIPFLAVILVYILLSTTRLSLFVNPSSDFEAPFCLNTFKTTLVLLLVGFGSYYLVNSGVVSYFKGNMCGAY